MPAIRVILILARLLQTCSAGLPQLLVAVRRAIGSPKSTARIALHQTCSLYPSKLLDIACQPVLTSFSVILQLVEPFASFFVRRRSPTLPKPTCPTLLKPSFTGAKPATFSFAVKPVIRAVRRKLSACVISVTPSATRPTAKRPGLTRPTGADMVRPAKLLSSFCARKPTPAVLKTFGGVTKPATQERPEILAVTVIKRAAGATVGKVMA